MSAIGVSPDRAYSERMKSPAMYRPAPPRWRVYLLVALFIGGWAGGFYGLVRLHGHFSGATADVVYLAWTVVYWTPVWMFSRD